jgi:hypothetical protein
LEPIVDAIANQNVIRIYRSPADGQWRAHIGPDDGRGVEQLGATPCQALGRLIGQIHGGKYSFSESWCPEPAATIGVDLARGEDYTAYTLTVGGPTFACDAALATRVR